MISHLIPCYVCLQMTPLCLMTKPLHLTVPLRMEFFFSYTSSNQQMAFRSFDSCHQIYIPLMSPWMNNWMSTGLAGSNYCNSSFASYHIGSTCGNIKALVSPLIMDALTNLFHLPFLKHIWCDQDRISALNPCSFHFQKCDRDNGAFTMQSQRMKFTSAIIAVNVWGELFHPKKLTWLDT